MTVIAALVQGNTMAIAGDRAACVGSQVFTLSSPKVAKIGKYLIGYYGSLEGDRLLKMFKFPEPPKDPDQLDAFMYTILLRDLEKFYEEQRFDRDDTENGLGMVFMVGGRIYDHDICDGSMIRYEGNYLGVGSGGPYAMGSLHASSLRFKDTRARVEMAVEAACLHSTGCALPVDSFTMRLT